MAKKRLQNLACEMLQPLGANIPGVPLVELMGNQRLLIENHKGLIGYSDHTVMIKLKGGYISVQGEGLTVCRMTDNALVIKGRILTVQFPEDSKI